MSRQADLSSWCNLCIDLDSLTAEIFRRTCFLSLDGIIISACCKVRHIFTMKNEPADCMDGEETAGVKASITTGPTPQDSSHIAFGSKSYQTPSAHHQEEQHICKQERRKNQV
ncbi:hypothetical protein cypCar_00044008 [Cyprinus carpio]|nr:hypothetical protein cypCar_00044008 [Cyprinus carpio]